MYYFYSRLLIRYILQLKCQFLNHVSFGWILLLLIVISIIWSVYNIVSWSQHFCQRSLSYIMITGKRYYTTNSDIYNVIQQLDALGTFITQDVNIIQNQIECLPWVQQVSVRKKWPDTLKIHIVEHIPVAFWNDSQIISVAGKIFNISFKENQDDNLSIPVLYGPEGNILKVLTYYYMFDEILKKSVKLQIKSLKMDMRNSWQLVLKDNMYVKLGRKNVIERLNYFIKIYPILLHKINENNSKYIDYVDLRYTSGFAVKWIPHSITSVLCKKINVNAGNYEHD